MRNLISLLLYFSFILVLATVFVVDSRFAQGLIFGKNLWFCGSMVLAVVFSIIHFLINKQPLRFKLLDIFVFLFIFSVFLSTFGFNGNSVANSNKIILLSLLFVLYLCLRLILEKERLNFPPIIVFFVIFTGLVESVWGLFQLYGFKNSQHELFKLTGSFFNPGPYAGYLSVVFPLSLHWFLKSHHQLPVIKPGAFRADDEISNSLIYLKIKRIFDNFLPVAKKIFGGITCVAILLVLPAAMSRASWLAAIVGSIVVISRLNSVPVMIRKITFKSSSKRLKNFVFVLTTSLLFAAFAGMYYLKKDSADGRLLMWKVSFSALVQHPLGVGLGNFPSAYGDAQAVYFASGNVSKTEEYVAGNPEYGFNEFLQIGIESGIIGLLLFIGMLVSAFQGLFKSKNWGVMGALVSLLVFACFSYPFSVLPFLTVFVFLLTMSTPGGTRMTRTGRICTDKKSAIIRSICVICVPVICTTITAFCLWKQYPVYGAYKQWKRNQVYYQTGMYREIIQIYEPLYPYLNDQIQFLFEYGRSLSMSEQPEKSNEVLKRAMQISCDPMLYNIMGKNCQATKEYGLAEKSLRKSALIVPNRIYPYYLLMKLYVETGDEEKAYKTASIVLTKEPKVQSTAVREMRQEAGRIYDGELRIEN